MDGITASDRDATPGEEFEPLRIPVGDGSRIPPSSGGEALTATRVGDGIDAAEIGLAAEHAVERPESPGCQCSLIVPVEEPWTTATAVLGGDR